VRLMILAIPGSVSRPGNMRVEDARVSARSALVRSSASPHWMAAIFARWRGKYLSKWPDPTPTTTRSGPPKPEHATSHSVVTKVIVASKSTGLSSAMLARVAPPLSRSRRAVSVVLPLKLWTRSLIDRGRYIGITSGPPPGRSEPGRTAAVPELTLSSSIRRNRVLRASRRSASALSSMAFSICALARAGLQLISVVAASSLTSGSGSCHAMSIVSWRSVSQYERPSSAL